MVESVGDQGSDHLLSQFTSSSFPLEPLGHSAGYWFCVSGDGSGFFPPYSHRLLIIFFYFFPRFTSASFFIPRLIEYNPFLSFRCSSLMNSWYFSFFKVFFSSSFLLFYAVASFFSQSFLLSSIFCVNPGFLRLFFQRATIVLCQCVRSPPPSSSFSRLDWLDCLCICRNSLRISS